MSTKVTILDDGKSNWFEKNPEGYYHFYFDYKDGDAHLDCDENGKREFLRRVAKLLESNPFTDSGIYAISLEKREIGKMCPKCGMIVGIENDKA